QSGRRTGDGQHDRGRGVEHGAAAQQPAGQRAEREGDREDHQQRDRDGPQGLVDAVDRSRRLQSSPDWAPRAPRRAADRWTTKIVSPKKPTPRPAQHTAVVVAEGPSTMRNTISAISQASIPAATGGRGSVHKCGSSGRGSGPAAPAGASSLTPEPPWTR